MGVMTINTGVHRPTMLARGLPTRQVASPVCMLKTLGLLRRMIVGLTTMAMLAGMLTAGCASRSASVLQREGFMDVGQERPELTRERLPVHQMQERLEESAMRGRVLVKIEKAETLKHYRPEAFGENARRETFPQLRELSSRLRVHYASELGLSKTGNPLVQLHLAVPRRAEDVEAALGQLHFHLRRDYGWPQQSDALVDMLVVEGDLGLGGGTELEGGRRRFPQLRPESHLNVVFAKLGVGSIRRVFRMTEQPDGKGTLEVVPLSRLLDEAGARYPLRTARGYANLSPAQDIEDWFLLRLDREADLAGVAAALGKARGIVTALFDYKVEYHQAPQNEPGYPSQWALHPALQWGIDALPAWNVVTANPLAVRVAVIDSGFQENLDELAGRIWSKACRSGQVPTVDRCEIPANGIDDDINGYVDDVTGVTTNDRYEGVPGPLGTGGAVVAGDHGTKVAGIIAANATNGVLIAGVAGANPVALMNISLGLGTSCGGAELAEAIIYATLEGADIANMSLSVRPQYLVDVAMEAALSRDGGGVTLIASAGNRNRRVTVNYLTENATYPAWYPGVISVGGTDRNGRRWVEASPGTGSNYGVGLDLVAPAKDVATVTYTAGSTAAIPATMTGTSASAAIVSGVAAIVLSHYPTTRVERMNAWLRATVTDILDPEGTRANLVGDDLYTGAGLVNGDRAATQGTPDPVVVDVLVEGSVGRPDLGITVQGPVFQWTLDYGAGDWPTEWLSLSVPASVRSQEIDVTRTYPGGGFVDVAPGHNYLDTDTLTNRQVYTLRLTATDGQGRTYVAYDQFMPIRAMITHPNKNDTVPTKWGWPNIYGMVDLRPGAGYELQMIDQFGFALPGWHVGPIPSDNIWPGLDAERRIHGSGFAALMSPECAAPWLGLCTMGWNAPAGPPAFQVQPIGPGMYTIRLTVYSPGGIATHDTQETIVDNTSFATRPGWPVAIPTNLTFSPGWGPFPQPRGVAAAAMTGTSDRRIFVHTDGHFVSLQPNGTVLWDLPMRFKQDLNWEDQRFGPAFLIDDLDGDGTKEILVCDAGRILLLKTDGTRYSQSSTFPPSHDGCGKLHAGDVNGDGVKEVVFVKRTSSRADPPQDAEVHVTDLSGQLLPGWPVALPGKRAAALQVGDVDGDGTAEILVDNIWLYGGNGQLRLGWPMSNSFGSSSFGGFQLVKLNPATLDSGLQILAYDLIGPWPGGRYAVDVRNSNGAGYASGWPVYLDTDIARIDRGYQSVSPIYAKAAQLIVGDPLEIVLCYDKIRVLQADGSAHPALPPIDLNGQCHGLDVVDVDGDGQLEYVALVSRFEDDDGWKTDAHAELEAYRLNSIQLSATDSRWPIRVVSPSSEPSKTGHSFMALGNSVALQDVDGDGGLDLIQSLFVRPYRAGGNNFGLRDNLIEVLNIR